MMGNRERQQRFEALLREHQRIIFKIARMYTRTVPDRDDLAQEIAAQAWRSFGAFDATRAKFSTWLYRVALNVAISHVRSVARAGPEPLQSLDGACLDTVAAGEPSHDDAVEHDQRIAALNFFMAGLDPLNRALVLLYLEDRSYSEIAGILGISETNVATKINRVKNKLRGRMTAAEPEGVKNGTR